MIKVQISNNYIQAKWLFELSLNFKQFIGTYQLSRPESDGNERIMHMPANYCITGASSSDCFELYAGHLIEESYPSAEM